MGRPRKAIAEKALAGTLERRMIPGTIGSADTEIQPADFIGEEQLPYFNEIVRHVKENEALLTIDSYAISMCAQYLYIFTKSAMEIRRSGFIQVYEKTGAMAKHPYLQALTEASKELKVWFTELGMTPKSREALASFQVKHHGEDDIFEKLLKTDS
jgi:P27 family predicted phage terminase small subunit